MTYQDVFIQILSEVSGKPKAELTDLLESFKKIHPGGKWDRYLSETEGEKLLNDLRKEKAGIAKWLVEGAAMVAQHESDTNH